MAKLVNVFNDLGPKPVAPDAPSLGFVVSGTTVTVSIAGDADAEHHLQYKLTHATAWSDGGSRSDDGDLVVEDLTAGAAYHFSAYSVRQALRSPDSPTKHVDIPGVPISGDVTADSWMSEPAGLLGQMIASTAAFQTATSTASQAAALVFVHLADYTPEDRDFTRPFAIVCRDKDDRLGASGQVTSAAGHLSILTEMDIPAAYLPAERADDAELYFTNYLGAMTREIMELSYGSGQLIITGIKVAQGPTRIESNGSDTGVYGAELHVSYGIK